MCTVTLIPRPAHPTRPTGPTGFRLVVNRDEQRTRPPATPPRLFQHPPQQALYPLDPPSAGTWIAVSNAGLALTLLNQKLPPPETPETPQAPQTPEVFSPISSCASRGTIIPALLHLPDLPAVLNAAAALDPKNFAPFRLLIVSDHHVATVNSNGQTIQTQRQPHPQTPTMLTSSGLGDHLVQPPRRALFDTWFTDTPHTWPDQQDRFHRHHWPDRPHLSIQMQRPDARTVGRTVIEVSDRRVQLHHENLTDTPHPKNQTQNHDTPCLLALPRTTHPTRPTRPTAAVTSPP